MSTRYVGGPFDGGDNPDDLIDEIQMRTPLGAGRYVRETDETTGGEIFRWEPEALTHGSPGPQPGGSGAS